MRAGVFVAAVVAATILVGVVVFDDDDTPTSTAARTDAAPVVRSSLTHRPSTFVMCGPKGDYNQIDIYVTQNDGHDLQQLTQHAQASSLTAAREVALAAITVGKGQNGLIQLTSRSSGSSPGTMVPTSINMSGTPRLSRDGRYLAYVEVFADGSGGLRDAAMVIRRGSGEGPRRVADAFSISDLDFDARNRLHVLTAVGGAGSIISAGDSARAQLVLRRRTYVLRYSSTDRLALSGSSWAEVRTLNGRVIAQRRNLVVLGWAREGHRVLVRRIKDDRVAYWNYASNKLSLWPRLRCGRPYFVEQ